MQVYKLASNYIVSDFEMSSHVITQNRYYLNMQLYDTVGFTILLIFQSVILIISAPIVKTFEEYN